MKQNNLQKISDLLDNLEIGLKSFFYRIRKADRADRFHGPNCHGFYRAKEGQEEFSFRVTMSEVTPPDLSVWQGVDHLFVIHGSEVRVYITSLLEKCLSEGNHLSTVAPIFYFTIDNKHHVVISEDLTIPFKSIRTDWNYTPLRFLPRKRSVIAVRIDGDKKGKRFNSYGEAAETLNISINTIKNNLRGKNTVVKGSWDGEEASISFLSLSQYDSFLANKKERDAWYKERQEIVISKRQRKTRSDVGKKHKLTMDQTERDKMIMSLFVQANREKLDELKELPKAA